MECCVIPVSTGVPVNVSVRESLHGVAGSAKNYYEVWPMNKVVMNYTRFIVHVLVNVT